jgi:multisubunit Na+/H+ antiporter MnhC subunit
MKKIIFWLSYTGIIYLILLIGQSSLNPLKWGYVNYDDIHGMPIALRLTGMIVSLCVLTIFLSIINSQNNRNYGTKS